MSGRTRYTETFRTTAIRRIVEQGHSVKDVSEDLGVTQKTLYDWLKKLSAIDANKDSASLLKEIEALKAELEKVKAEKEILKQAAILIAQQN